MKIDNCEIFKDLLPLYMDNILSSSSREFIEKHLDSCEKCKKEFLKSSKDKSGLESMEIDIKKRIDKKIKKTGKKIVAASIIFTIIILTGIYLGSHWIEWTIPYEKERILLVEDESDPINISSNYLDYQGQSMNMNRDILNIDGKNTYVAVFQYRENLNRKYLSQFWHRKIENKDRTADMNLMDWDFINGRGVRLDAVKIYYLNSNKKTIDLKMNNEELKYLEKEGELVLEKDFHRY